MKLKDNGGDFMTEEELKAIELLKEDIDYRESDLAEYISDRKYSNAERTIINLVNKQQEEIKEQKDLYEKLLNGYNERVKEIEELEKENFDTVYIQAVENYKTKIREIIYGNYEDLEIILLIKELLGE